VEEAAGSEMLGKWPKPDHCPWGSAAKRIHYCAIKKET